jgi:hypothetical protein
VDRPVRRPPDSRWSQPSHLRRLQLTRARTRALSLSNQRRHPTLHRSGTCVRRTISRAAG